MESRTERNALAEPRPSLHQRLVELTDSLRGVTDVGPLGRLLAEGLRDLLDADAVVIHRCDPRELRSIAEARGRALPSSARRVAERLAEQAVDLGEPQEVPHGLGACYAVPLRSGGQEGVFGALSCLAPALDGDARAAVSTLSAEFGRRLVDPQRLPSEFAGTDGDDTVGERERRLEALGDLAGGIAHDFNNALTSILGNVSLARLHGGITDSVDRLLSDAEQACLKARRLTRQLLTFAGGGEPIRRPTDLGALVREVVDEASADGGHRFLLGVAGGLPRADIDDDQVRQAVVFLLEHACHVMPEGGDVVVRVELADNGVEVVVEDQGPAIPADLLERVFDPYTAGLTGPRGLGLSAVHSIARRHGGRVDVVSRGPVGSVFRLRLPVEVYDATPAARHALHPGEPRGPARVLLMDDDASVRASLARMIGHLGHRVDEVDDGQRALDAWQSAVRDGDPFDLVLMDLTIPHGMGGREAVRRLLELDPAARAVVASGYSKDPIMAHFREHGFVAMLEKPCELATLRRVLDDVLEA